MSNPGDRIGEGFTQRVGLDEARFSVTTSVLTGGRADVTMEVRPTRVPGDWWWILRFTMPPGQSLRTGTFNASGWPGRGDLAGLQFFGSGKVCIESTGRFTITALELGQGQTLNRLQMTFEQLCDSGTAPSRGEISIVANPWR